MRRRALLAVALALVVAVPLCADESANLLALARVWAAVKFLDPAMATSDIDWDAALVHAIPRVRAARNDAELANAIDSMLAELHDPATHIVRETPKPAQPGAADVPISRTDGDVLVINLGPYAVRNPYAATMDAVRTIAPSVAKANGVVIDLRCGPEQYNQFVVNTSVKTLPLTDAPLFGPTREYAFHSGYSTQSAGSDSYYSALLEVTGAPIAASHEGAPHRIAFVTDAMEGVPDLAVAIRGAGRAIIAATDAGGDELAQATDTFDLPGGAQLQYRIANFKEAGVAVDVIAADPVAASVAFLQSGKPMPQVATKTAAVGKAHFRADNSYPDMTYPDVEHRLLAAVRLWAVIHYFYPYLDLIGDWDHALETSIPHFIAASNADEYARAALEMDAHVEDSHSYVPLPAAYHKVLGGDGWLPGTLRLLESQFVIVDSDVPELKSGDVIESVDGEPLRTRIDRLMPLVTASREIGRARRAAAYALRGPVGSDMKMVVRRADGAHAVTVKRVEPKSPDSKNAYRVLDGNIGYADLTRLIPSQVDAMFDALGNTRAIIFDMRGYPNGTAWPIAPRINTRHAKIGALFRRREVSGMNTGEQSGADIAFEQPLPPLPPGKSLYTGKTVMLIDERAVSQSEHTCLFFEQAAGTKFIGSATSGANGDVTQLVLPGGIAIYFTGHDVRHADGRQLQRVGIQPDVEVWPTIAGLRAGRDEVLDRAIQYLNDASR